MKEESKKGKGDSGEFLQLGKSDQKPSNDDIQMSGEEINMTSEELQFTDKKIMERRSSSKQVKKRAY